MRNHLVSTIIVSFLSTFLVLGSTALSSKIVFLSLLRERHPGVLRYQTKHLISMSISQLVLLIWLRKASLLVIWEDITKLLACVIKPWNWNLVKKNHKDLITKWVQTQISLGCEQN